MTRHFSDAVEAEQNGSIETALAIFSEAFGKDISPKIADFAKAARISKCDSTFSILAQNAILACIFQHRIINIKRSSGYKADLSRLSKKSRAAAVSMRALESEMRLVGNPVLRQVFMCVSDSDVQRIRTLSDDISRLETFARQLEQIAHALRERGGPAEKTAFRVLVLGLARAFEHGSGRRATVTRNPIDDTYSGDFLELVRAVAPLAANLAAVGGGPPLDCPGSTSALGAYVASVTSTRSREKPSGRTE